MAFSRNHSANGDAGVVGGTDRREKFPRKARRQVHRCWCADCHAMEAVAHCGSRNRLQSLDSRWEIQAAQ